jgi:hypothetical protein
MTFSCISFNRSPPPWLRIRYIILTFCRRSMIILIYFCILLRLLEINMFIYIYLL